MTVTTPPFFYVLFYKGTTAERTGLTPPLGTHFWDTDTTSEWVWDGSAWDELGGGGGGGVTSLDGGGGALTGAVTLSPGVGITLTQAAQNIEVAAPGLMEAFDEASDTNSGGNTFLDWTTATQSGDTLLDPTNPTAPVWVADGVYTLIFKAEINSGATTGDLLEMLALVDAEGGALPVVSAPLHLELTASNPSPAGAITVPVKALAGDKVQVKITQGATTDPIVTIVSVWIVKH